MTDRIVPDVTPGCPFFLIAGPCVIEGEKSAFQHAKAIKEITDDFSLPFVFKASYDKANRTAMSSYRGPGLTAGLQILSGIRQELEVPVLSDVHLPQECEPAGEVLDILQIPAFLCRQTDLLVAAAATGKPVNVKRGQFLAPWDMKNVAGKLTENKSGPVLLTERGTTFGYNRLVNDMTAIAEMQKLGFPVIFDATHSVQLPGGLGTATGGQREYVPLLARSAVAAGCDALFLEVHEDPDNAKSDGPNMVELSALPKVLTQILAVRKAFEETCQ